MIKRIKFLIVMVLISLGLSAQTDCSKEIQESFAIYRHEMKQKNYSEALKSWRRVAEACPDYNPYLYTDGPKLYHYIIKQDKENTSLYLDTLMNLYDLRIQYFGDREKVLGKKGSDLFRYDPSKYIEAYNMLKISVEYQGNLSLPSLIVPYFRSLVQTEKNTDNVSKQDILDAYVTITDIIDYNIELAKSDVHVREYKKALKKVEDQFEPYASCEELINVFSDRINVDTDNVSLLKKVVYLLSKKDCKENDVFYIAVSKLHDIEPTSSSAYNMGNMCMEKKKYSEAVDYYNQAIKMAQDETNLAAYYYQLSYALRMNRSYSSARSAALKSAELNPESGKPYMMIGDIYLASANSCGGSKLEIGSVYWAAVDMFMKAKSTDNLLTEQANKRISKYSKYFPSKEDCFFENIQEGDSYRVKCWIDRSTRVRTRD